MCKSYITSIYSTVATISGPPTIDFGQVCLRSVSIKHLEIVNNLDQYVQVVAEVNRRLFYVIYSV